MKTKITTALATRNLKTATESLARTLANTALSDKQRAVKVAASEAAIARWKKELGIVDVVEVPAAQGSVATKVELKFDRNIQGILCEGMVLTHQTEAGPTVNVLRIGKPMISALLTVHRHKGFANGTVFIWESKVGDGRVVAKVEGEKVVQLLAPKHDRAFASA